MSYEYKYPRPMVTVDALVFYNSKENTEVLLIKRGNPPFKDKWALPGGFVDMDESLDAAVKRELQEETGLVLNDLKQMYTFGDPNRDPRGRNISIVFFTSIDKKITPNAGDDANEAVWFNIKDLPELAFDHNKVINKSLSML